MKHPILIALILLFGFSDTEAATVTATVSANVLTLDQPGPVTLTWTATGAGRCLAGGDWSGSKNVAGGSETVQVTKTSTFSLACESPTGPITVKWTPPTKFTDGSSLGAIKNYVIFSGPSQTTLARNTTAPGDAVQTTFQASPGLQFVGVRTTATINGQDVESADSNVASKTVVADKATPAVTVSLTVRPMPPTNVTVE